MRPSGTAVAVMAALAGLARGDDPVGRYSHCTVMLDGAMYTFGGRGFASSGDKRSLELFGDMWAFYMDNVEWKLVDVTSSDDGLGVRSSHACAAIGDKYMFVFGGMSEHAGQQRLMDDLWRFEVTGRARGEWKRISSASDSSPGSRSDHALVPLGTRHLYLLGGCDNRASRQDAWRFDTDSRHWVEIPFGSGDDDRSQDVPSSSEQHSSVGDQGVGGDPGSRGASNTTDGEGGDDLKAVAQIRFHVPGERCAHTAVARGSGPTDEIVMFGGRVSVTVAGAQDGYDSTAEDMWASLADTWEFRPYAFEAWLRGARGNTTADRSDTVWRELEPRESKSAGDGDGNGEGEALLLNRSDHAGVVHKDQLYVFGGLFTDLEQKTVYIMKDLVSLHLKERKWTRLAWGPTWRFGHTLVDDPDRNRFLLYGGAGGMDVFGDLWAYEYDSESWRAIKVQDTASDYPTLLMSVLMGGAGFILCLCMMVSLLFLRTSHRLLWSRRNGGVGNPLQPTTARGASQATIEALPILKWHVVRREVESDPSVPGVADQDAEDHDQSAADDAPLRGGDGVPADVTLSRAASAAPGVAAAADDQRSLDASLCCVVCLSEFCDDEEVVRLPCRHIFHKQCIHRWLRQEGSCPQCRHKVSEEPATKAPVVVVEGTGAREPRSGTTVAAEPDASSSGTAIVEPRSQTLSHMPTPAATAVAVNAADAPTPRAAEPPVTGGGGDASGDGVEMPRARSPN